MIVTSEVFEIILQIEATNARFAAFWEENEGTATIVLMTPTKRKEIFPRCRNGKFADMAR